MLQRHSLNRSASLRRDSRAPKLARPRPLSTGDVAWGPPPSVAPEHPSRARPWPPPPPRPLRHAELARAGLARTTAERSSPRRRCSLTCGPLQRRARPRGGTGRRARRPPKAVSRGGRGVQEGSWGWVAAAPPGAEEVLELPPLGELEVHGRHRRRGRSATPSSPARPQWGQERSSPALPQGPLSGAGEEGRRGGGAAGRGGARRPPKAVAARREGRGEEAEEEGPGRSSRREGEGGRPPVAGPARLAMAARRGAAELELGHGRRAEGVGEGRGLDPARPPLAPDAPAPRQASAAQLAARGPPPPRAGTPDRGNIERRISMTRQEYSF